MRPEGEDYLRAYNLGKARFLTRLAWTIEIVLVITGIGIAVAQATGAGVATRLFTAFPVFGVFLILAVAELSKIPSATVAFHARGWGRALAALALVVATGISFETVFNGFERFTFAMTATVTEARQGVTDLEAERARLASWAAEVDPSDVAGQDAERRALLREQVAAAQAGYEAAVARGESSETRELREQLAEVVALQAAEVERARKDWDDEQQSLERRLRPDSGLDGATRAQLQERMRRMPARQSVTDAAAAKFAGRVAELQARIEASVRAPSAKARVQAAKAAESLDAARAALAAFEAEAAGRQRERVERAVQDGAAARARAGQVKALEDRLVEANRAVAEAAARSQMHRWAAFVFGADPGAVTDAQVKTVAAAFGAALAVAASLAGSVTAIFAEWFRVRGVEPVTVPVPVEVPVRVEVPVEIRVPVECVRFVHVPMPPGMGIVDDVLAALPPRLAAQLRAELDGVALDGGGSAA
jgi:hypothetical protein